MDAFYITLELNLSKQYYYPKITYIQNEFMKLWKAYYKLYMKSISKELSKKKAKIMNLMINMTFCVK